MSLSNTAALSNPLDYPFHFTDENTEHQEKTKGLEVPHPTCEEQKHSSNVVSTMRS